MPHSRCFVSLESPAQESSVADLLRVDGADVVEMRDAVHVVGHFDVAVVSDELPPGIWADVLVRLRPEGALVSHGTGDLEVQVSVESMGELMALLSAQIHRDRRSEST